MGWKHFFQQLFTRGSYTLSENQCGMETVSPPFACLVLCTVEREPMWDGNMASMLPPSPYAPRLSENQCGMETRLENDVQRANLLLSENQCGMETSLLLTVYWFRRLLSENQCGMETSLCLVYLWSIVC